MERSENGHIRIIIPGGSYRVKRTYLPSNPSRINRLESDQWDNKEQSKWIQRYTEISTYTPLIPHLNPISTYDAQDMTQI